MSSEPYRWQAPDHAGWDQLSRSSLTETIDGQALAVLAGHPQFTFARAEAFAPVLTKSPFGIRAIKAPAVWEREDDLLGPWEGGPEHWEKLMTTVLPPEFTGPTPLALRLLTHMYLLRAALGDSRVLDMYRLVPYRQFNLLVLRSGGALRGGDFMYRHSAIADAARSVKHTTESWERISALRELPPPLRDAATLSLIESLPGR